MLWIFTWLYMVLLLTLLNAGVATEGVYILYIYVYSMYIICVETNVYWLLWRLYVFMYLVYLYFMFKSALLYLDLFV